MKRDKVSKVFFCTERNLVIPEELYDATEAEKWFRSIHFMEPGDAITDHEIGEEYQHYLYAVPLYIRELISINCPNAVMLPLALHQLTGINGQREQLQCFITPEQASVTWYKNNK